MTLDPRLLKIVVILAEELHFGRAAARLYLSQPSLSSRLKNLERDLGVELFKRSSRHVELTRSGSVFVEEARSLIMHSERVIAIVRGAALGIGGGLRVGYPPSINLHWLSSLMATMQRGSDQYLHADFVSHEPVALQELVLNGELHASFLLGRAAHPELNSMPLFREPLMAALPFNHKLASRGAVSMEEIHHESLVSLRRDFNPLLQKHFLEAFAALGFRARISREVTTFQECVALAGAGLGVALVPAWMRNDEAAAFVALTDDSLSLPCELIWRAAALHEGLESFSETVKRHTGGYPACVALSISNSN
jgi:DNA-binding transcriptional LysR family regulator